MATRNTSENELRKKNPYRVPDGYFSDLRNNIMARVAEQQAVEQTEADAGAKGLWGRMKGMVGFAAAFGSLVLFALVGFYFTGYQAQVKENEAQIAAVHDTGELMLGYTVHSEDVEALFYDLEDTFGEQTDRAEEQILFAEAVTEYLETFGYGTLTGPEIVAYAPTTTANGI